VPIASVLMPVRNGSKYLGESVASILSQDLADFEVIIVDDGSTDETPEVLRAINDARVHCIRLKRSLGLASALNRGLAECRSDLVIRMDSDDVCLPGRFRALANTMMQRPSLGILGSGAYLIDRCGQIVGCRSVVTGSHQVARKLRWRNPLIHPSVIFQRELVKTLGSYRTRAGICEDYDLWLRAAAVTEIDNFSRPLIAYRQHEGQVTAGRTIEYRAIATVWQSRDALAECGRESRLAALGRHTTWVAGVLLHRSRAELLRHIRSDALADRK
jgi:glycosyltransferase involved in cell wall biosynthesis